MDSGRFARTAHTSSWTQSGAGPWRGSHGDPGMCCPPVTVRIQGDFFMAVCSPMRCATSCFGLQEFLLSTHSHLKSPCRNWITGQAKHFLPITEDGVADTGDCQRSGGLWLRDGDPQSPMRKGRRLFEEGLHHGGLARAADVVRVVFQRRHLPYLRQDPPAKGHI